MESACSVGVRCRISISYEIRASQDNGIRTATVSWYSGRRVWKRDVPLAFVVCLYPLTLAVIVYYHTISLSFYMLLVIALDLFHYLCESLCYPTSLTCNMFMVHKCLVLNLFILWIFPYCKRTFTSSSLLLYTKNGVVKYDRLMRLLLVSVNYHSYLQCISIILYYIVVKRSIIVK